MKLIPLEEVRKIYNKNRYSQKVSDWYTESCPNVVVDVISINAIEELESLPTIDPITTIDEMIEEYKMNWAYIEWTVQFIDVILSDLKTRLLLTQK